jgi:hypothetical protein
MAEERADRAGSSGPWVGGCMVVGRGLNVSGMRAEEKFRV